VHQFQPLRGRELQHVIERRWVQLSLGAPLEDEADAAVVNAIGRITGGNFRPLRRLFIQIERVLTVNGLSTVDYRGRCLCTRSPGQRAVAINQSRTRHKSIKVSSGASLSFRWR
jgi:hypothetical protein